MGIFHDLRHRIGHRSSSVEHDASITVPSYEDSNPKVVLFAQYQSTVKLLSRDTRYNTSGID
jgi:hypothetical protein